MRLIDVGALIGSLHNHAFLEGDDRSIVYNVIQKQPTVGGWISMKDRLPEENLEYIVYATDEDGERFVTTDHWNKYVRQWYLFDKGSSTTVTHWMPMPEPPKEGNDD